MEKKTPARRLNEDSFGSWGIVQFVPYESTHSEETERILRDWPR